VGRTTRWTGIAAGTLALTVLAGCGSSAATSTRNERVDIATWRAGTESGTAKIAGRSTTTTPGKPDQVQASEGVIDFDRHLYAEKARVTSGPHAGHEFETRQIGDTMYWWDPSPDGPGRPTKPWTRSDIPWQAGAWKTTLDRAFTDPDATVTRTGDDIVRGEPVTNYRVDYPPHVPPRLLARGYPVGLTDLEIAVDRGQRVRRVQFSLQTTSGSLTHTELELYDDGTSVTVEPPPADQIDTSGGSPGRPVATGPWTDLATDGDGADRVVVSAVPTQEGTCFAVTGTGQGDNGWWTVAGRGTDDCMSAGPDVMEVQVSLRPISTDRQILIGQFDRSAAEVTLHLDDGSTVAVTPRQGAFAAIVRGNHVVERVEAAIPNGRATCDFAPDQTPLVYRCSSTVGSVPPDIAAMIPPEFAPPTTPATTPTTTPTAGPRDTRSGRLPRHDAVERRPSRAAHGRGRRDRPVEHAGDP
jgi:hypothetical protein